MSRPAITARSQRARERGARYGDEFAAILEERPLGPFDVADVLVGRGILMLVAILVVITLIWLAYSWALNQPGITNPKP